MVAVVEVVPRDPNLGLDPLPDIDFNIRCGNTLVGYATAKDLENDLQFGDMFAKQEFEDKVHLEMDKVAYAYERFKQFQLQQSENLNTYKESKAELKSRLKGLNALLNDKLYKSTVSEGSLKYEDWLKSHQPFHWLAEYYDIINGNGGFDVIIGNPPYVEYKKVMSIYKLSSSLYKTLDCGNLHAFVAERTFVISATNGNIGLIVPLPSINTTRMASLQNIIKNPSNNSVWISCFDERPSGLFEGVDQRLIVEIISRNTQSGLHSTKINRWLSENRNLLFKGIKYTKHSREIIAVH